MGLKKLGVSNLERRVLRGVMSKVYIFLNNEWYKAS